MLMGMEVQKVFMCDVETLEQVFHGEVHFLQIGRASCRERV